MQAAPAPIFEAAHAIRLVAAHVTSRPRPRQWVANDYFANDMIAMGHSEIRLPL